MALVRSVRKVVGRSRVLVLAVLVAAVFFTAGFVELAVTRHSMQAQHEQAKARVERTKRQNTLLQLQLERAQRGELLPWLAWEYYGKLPKDARGIETEAPEPVIEAGPVQPSPPQWQSWLSALGLN